MKPLKKVYCRSFQTVFKLAIPLLPYRTPTIRTSLADVPSLLGNRKKPLIVTDAGLKEVLRPLTSALDLAQIPYLIYDRVQPNPTIKMVEEAREIYLSSGCDALIGFGGGSSIDCAKAVGARIARPKRPIRKMEGILRILRKLPLLIAVPTTAGTGSETTPATVITDHITRHKFPINDLVLIPRAAVHDPTVMRNLPPHILATTGMDALTHAIEAYIGRSTVRSTRSDALEATRLICNHLETAYREPENLDAKAHMLHASYLAGRAFGKSYVGYCHAVAHSLGGKYNTPHGLANAVLLPYVLESYGAVIYNQLKELAVAAGIADEATPKECAARAIIQKIRQMNRAMHIPETLGGIVREDIPQLARLAEQEANPLYPVPVLMTAQELEQFYYDIMEEVT